MFLFNSNIFKSLYLYIYCLVLNGDFMNEVSPETMDALKSIGLNLYERKLYVALLSRGTSNVGELAELSKVPRSRCYDVLESLSDKGFVIIKNTKPIQYIAVPPAEAIDRAKENIKKKLQENIHRLESFKSSGYIDELSKLHKFGMDVVDLSDLTGMIKDRYSIYQHIGSMIKNTENSLDIITSEEGLIDLYRMHGALIQKASDRGISCRILAPITDKNKYVVDVLSSVCDIKDLNSIDDHKIEGRIILKDKKESVVSLTHDKEVPKSQDSVFWTASEHLARDILSPAFETMWKQAR